MSKEKTETLDNFQIKYKKHIFSKNIRITLKTDKKILVTMPYLCPYKTARDFLLSNFEKIKSVKLNTKKYTPDFKTKFDTLRIVKSQELKTFQRNGIVYFYYPENIDFSDNLIQREFSEAYKKALKIEAANYLPQRLSFLANKYGFSYNKVALKNQKMRFGSCSYQNNINLNINLMSYDFDVIDYVLIHELVHTKIKNHSQSFWSEVELYCPSYKNLRKRLKH